MRRARKLHGLPPELAATDHLGKQLDRKRAQAALAEWRARHPALDLVLVEGNHDVHAGAPDAALGITLVNAPSIDGPFALCHHPIEFADKYVLAGHLHPAYRLTGRRDCVRLPCFWFGPEVGVLPAFGDFTGAHAITPQPGDRVFVVADDRVLAVPARRAA